jgi:hypothetical protein
MLLAAAVSLFALLAFAGPAAGQTAGQVFCGPTIGYADVCPADVVRPIDDNAVDPGSLARTGSDSSLPLARVAIVLIGVGAALTVIAARKRVQHVSV